MVKLSAERGADLSATDMHREAPLRSEAMGGICGLAADVYGQALYVPQVTGSLSLPGQRQGQKRKRSRSQTPDQEWNHEAAEERRARCARRRGSTKSSLSSSSLLLPAGKGCTGGGIAPGSTGRERALFAGTQPVGDRHWVSDRPQLTTGPQRDGLSVFVSAATTAAHVAPNPRQKFPQGLVVESRHTRVHRTKTWR